MHNHAVITPEATLAHLSTSWQKHPTLGIDCKTGYFFIELDEAQTLTREILEKRTGRIRWHLRSALAQNGLQAFEPEYSDMTLSGNRLMIETIVSDVRSPQESPMINALLTLVKNKVAPLRVAHAGLFPHEAHIGSTAFDIERAYSMDVDFEPREIAEMLHGSARQWIEKHRKELDTIPPILGERNFFLGGIDVRKHNGHVVVLDPSVQRDGKPSEIVHLNSPILEKGRSYGGLRQVEIFNPGAPVPTGDLRVTGQLYRSQQEAQGV